MSNNYPRKFYCTIATEMSDIVHGDWELVKKSFEERSAAILSTAIVKMEELRKKYNDEINLQKSEKNTHNDLKK